MVKVIKNKSILTRLRIALSSPFSIPFLMLLFVVLTSPVLYFVSQRQIDIRQRAATIASGSVSITTPEGDFKKAEMEVIPESTVNIIIGILVVIVATSGVLIFRAYRRRSSY